MPTHPVRFGLQTGQQNVEWKDLVDLWKAADDWGYDSLWTFDHFYPIFTDPTGPCMEGWTTLAALSQVTSKARIGHLVNGNTYRHPSLVAKSAATLDIVSNGRLNLGLGAGWFEQEHHSLGFDFKTVLGRLEALEESLIIIKGMHAGEAVTLEGKHYQVNDAICVPAPVQDGGTPIMIGGTGRKILLRIVAQYADMWNAPGSPTQFAEMVGIIEQHCNKVDRDPAKIEKTVMMPLCYTDDEATQDFVCDLLVGAYGISKEEARAQSMIGGKDECLEKTREFVDAGCTHFIFMLIPPYPHDQLQAFIEEVAPVARG
jgi:F420-dependent oxidoreductase-like protein